MKEEPPETCPMGAPGLAYSHAVPQPGMAASQYKSDHQRYHAAWHAANCQIENCEWCKSLCDQGLVIACDECGRVHHTDWLGWSGDVDDDKRCTVLCPECRHNNQAQRPSEQSGATTRNDTNAN